MNVLEIDEASERMVFAETQTLVHDRQRLAELDDAAARDALLCVAHAHVYCRFHPEDGEGLLPLTQHTRRPV